MNRMQSITASVRTTNRMNALLTESMLNKRKALFKMSPDGEADTEGEPERPRNEFKFFSKNFSMEKVHKIIQNTVEERLTWDRVNRSYDSWRALQLAQNLTSEIRMRIKNLKMKRHRIVCFITIVERQNQGFSAKMRHLMDAKLDNFTSYIHERPTYFMAVTAFLVHKD